MKRQSSLLMVFFSQCFAWSMSGVAADKPPSYEEARQASWMLTSQLIKVLDEGDADKWPGTQTWLKDFRDQTKGIGKDMPVAKWPAVDLGKLVDHNPNFWRMYYEIAPADPMMTLIHAGLLLSQGEAMRAAYVLELGQHRPGIPKEAKQAMQALQHTAIAALKETNALTNEGIKLFDQGDYDGALKKYREALAICPQNGSTNYELGYTLRTQAAIARGEPVGKQGEVKVNGTFNDSPEVTAAFAQSRRHDPLQFMAYQGKDPEVIKAFLAMAKTVRPAWKTLREKGISAEEEYHALKDLSEGFSEAGVHDLALFARQLMAARRNGYAPEDYPILVAGLRKLAPGEAIEAVLARLHGGKGKELLTFRPLMKQDEEEGQPQLGSGERLYLPDKPPPKSDRNKPVRVDSIRLLTNEDDIAKRVKVDDFGKFSKDFDKIAEEVLGKSETPCKVLVQFKCTPAGHTVKIMHQPKDVDEKPLKAMYEALAKMDKLPVKEESVEFQIYITVTPKNKPPSKDK
jgi:tetratricopeptide (TPR) repeat protein